MVCGEAAMESVTGAVVLERWNMRVLSWLIYSLVSPSFKNAWGILSPGGGFTFIAITYPQTLDL